VSFAGISDARLRMMSGTTRADSEDTLVLADTTPLQLRRVLLPGQGAAAAATAQQQEL
jgi:hypothetical protein